LTDIARVPHPHLLSTFELGVYPDKGVFLRTLSSNLGDMYTRGTALSGGGGGLGPGPIVERLQLGLVFAWVWRAAVLPGRDASPLPPHPAVCGFGPVSSLNGHPLDPAVAQLWFSAICHAVGHLHRCGQRSALTHCHHHPRRPSPAPPPPPPPSSPPFSPPPPFPSC
jgi:hypothetical protein